MAFLEITDLETVVNHKDGNPLNNNVSNLEFVTNAGNVKHALENGLTVPSTKRVAQYDMNGNFLAVYNSVKEAERATGASSKHIPSVCRGKRGSTGGFIWKYSDEKDKPVNMTDFGIEHKTYPGYFISSDGKVYSSKSNRYMVLRENNAGYFVVSLSNLGVVKTFLVHRLVAELYISNPDNKPAVNHKNKDTRDNRISNLEWVTHSENISHALKSSTNIYRKAVSQYDLTGNFICEYESVKDANIQTGVDNSSIVKCCKGKVGHAGKFIWRYKE